MLQSDWFATIPGKWHNAINSVLTDPFPVGWGLAHETMAEVGGRAHVYCAGVC